MSSESLNTEPPVRNWRTRLGTLTKWFLIAVLAVFVLALVLPILGYSPVAEFVWHLGFGWLRFVKTNFEEVDWRWDRIAAGVLMIGVAGAAGHALARWWTRQLGGKMMWRLRWTLCGMVVLGTMAVAAISFAGIVHQVAWLGGEPWVADASRAPWAKVNRLRQLGMLTQMFAEENAGRFPADLSVLRTWAVENAEMDESDFNKLCLFCSVGEGTPEQWTYLAGGHTVDTVPAGVLFVSPRPVNGRWLVGYFGSGVEVLPEPKFTKLRVNLGAK